MHIILNYIKKYIIIVRGEFWPKKIGWKVEKDQERKIKDGVDVGLNKFCYLIILNKKSGI